MNYLDPIPETSYLSVSNTPQYRTIMRIFFREYEKMHYQLYKEDVLEMMRREDPLYADYDMERVKQDLQALVGWKNLTPIQDPGRVYTIAEYKNKQYRYSMSEAAVEIERMTIRLENLFVESGNLSTNFFVRIETALNRASDMQEASGKDINEWWNDLQEDFKRLNQNYQDYLREFYSGQADTIIKSMEFIVHKDRFIAYLNEFIRQLSRHARRLERLIREQMPLMEGQILEKVIQSELDIPHAISEMQGNREPSIRENVIGKWDSLKRWFVDDNGREAEYRRVLAITNDIIHRIITNAAMIVQLTGGGISRREDYRQFLRLFANCSDIRDAHCLSAHLFGVATIRHFKVNAPREVDGINESVYEEEPITYTLRPRTKRYREKRNSTAIADHTMEKELQRRAYLKKAEQERAIVKKYIVEGSVDLARITDIIPAYVRTTFLSWIAQANASSTKEGQTEYGDTFTIHKNEGEITLHCEDGELIMPAYVLEFK